MATVQEVIVNPALRSLGVLAAGEVPAYDDSADALIALNNLLDQWASERLQIYALVNTTFALTASQASYTIGSGGNVAIARPVLLDHVNYIDTSLTPDAEFPLTKLTDDDWAGIQIKALTAAIPTAWWYQTSFPTGTLYFWPVPTGTTLSGSLYVPTAVVQFAALTTSVSLPPGYQRMLTSNLALELAPDYGALPQPSLVTAATDSKAAVKRMNKKLTDMTFSADALIGSRGRSYDIRVG